MSMAEVQQFFEPAPDPRSGPGLSVVDVQEGYSPYPEMFADFFEKPGASLTVITRNGKQVLAESTDQLSYSAYCQGSVGIGKGTCEGPLIEPGENHIETTVIDPVTDEEKKSRYFYHVPCYVQHKLGYAVDVTVRNPAETEHVEVLPGTRLISKVAMEELFGPLPENLARRGNR